MITPMPQQLDTQYDPLSVQFMTGGQMGYMPKAQYLTPYEYGAFRTMPTPRTQQFQPQRPGFFESYLAMNRGSIMGSPDYLFNTYNPTVNQQQFMYSMRRNAQDSMLSLGTNIADWGMMSAASSALSTVLGPLGFAAGFALPSMLAEPIMDRVRSTRAIQDSTMSKIVGGSDMNLATGMGFNSRSARGLDSFMRVASSGDALFKEGDYRELLSLGVKYGMFDYANNANQYKEAIKKLHGTLTTAMEVLGSNDFEDLMQEFKRLQTLGASQDQYKSILRQENMFSRMTGLSHGDMINTYGKQGSLIFSQAGMDPFMGSLQAMSNAAMITMAQRNGLLTPAQVARQGGVSGMTQRMTQEDASGRKQLLDFLAAQVMNDDFTGVDKDRLPSLVKMARMHPDEMVQQLRNSSQRIQSASQLSAYQANKADAVTAIQKHLGGANGMELYMASLAQNFGFSRGETNPTAALTLGYRALFGMSPEIAQNKAKMVGSKDFQDQVNREQELHRRKQREEQAVENSPLRKLGLSVTKAVTSFAENLYGLAVNPYLKWSQDRADIDAGYLPKIQGSLSPAQLRGSATDPISRSRGRVARGRIAQILHNPDIGSLSRMFESENDGARKIAYLDDSAGTTYGTHQLSSNKGSLKEFFDYLRDSGRGSMYDYAMQFKGDWDTGGTTGPAVTHWNNMLDKFGKGEVEKAETEFFTKKYNSMLSKLSPELQARIKASPSLQKMVFDGTVQHGGTIVDIMNIADRQTRAAGKNSNEDLSDAVYAERKKRFPKLEKRNAQQHANVLHQLDDKNNIVKFGLLLEKDPKAISRHASNAAYTLTEKYKNTPYKRGGSSLDPNGGGIDCSNWVRAYGMQLMDNTNEALGAAVYSNQDKAALKGTSEEIIENFSRRGNTVREYTQESLITAIKSGEVSANMIIGTDNGDYDYDKGRKRGIDHVLGTFEKEGVLYVTHSSSKRGVQMEPAEEYVKKMRKRLRRAYVVDPLEKYKTARKELAPGNDAQEQDRVRKYDAKTREEVKRLWAAGENRGYGAYYGKYYANIPAVTTTLAENAADRRTRFAEDMRTLEDLSGNKGLFSDASALRWHNTIKDRFYASKEQANTDTVKDSLDAFIEGENKNLSKKERKKIIDNIMKNPDIMEMAFRASLAHDDGSDKHKEYTHNLTKYRDNKTERDRIQSNKYVGKLTTVQLDNLFFHGTGQRHNTAYKALQFLFPLLPDSAYKKADSSEEKEFMNHFSTKPDAFSILRLYELEKRYAATGISQEDRKEIEADYNKTAEELGLTPNKLGTISENDNILEHYRDGKVFSKEDLDILKKVGAEKVEKSTWKESKEDWTKFEGYRDEYFTLQHAQCDVDLLNLLAPYSDKKVDPAILNDRKELQKILKRAEDRRAPEKVQKALRERIAINEGRVSPGSAALSELPSSHSGEVVPTTSADGSFTPLVPLQDIAPRTDANAALGQLPPTLNSLTEAINKLTLYLNTKGKDDLRGDKPKADPGAKTPGVPPKKP